MEETPETRKEKLLSRESKTAIVHILLEEKLWDAKKVAQILGISINTVWGYKARAEKYCIIIG